MKEKKNCDESYIGSFIYKESFTPKIFISEKEQNYWWEK